MSVNDKEIDVLLRRYGKSESVSSGGHLDADELNAFAEGALPASARQRYVSHLADCENCRKLAGQLVIATGNAVETQVPTSQPVTESWWRKLAPLFAPPALRYAAFALVLVAVIGVSFLAWRRPGQQSSETAASRQSTTESGGLSQSAPAETTERQKEEIRKPEDLIAKAVPQATVAPFNQPGATTTTTNPAVAAKAQTESEKSALAARAPETPRVEASPSYAPPPPGENYKLEDRAREQRNAADATASGLRRSDYDKNKSLDRTRAGDVAKERDEQQKIASDQPKAIAQQQASNENKDDSSSRTASGIVELRGRSAPPAKREARKSEPTDEESETRSAGGRKFRRQGNSWVDSKFKSSMSVRNVSRSSEDFEKLDSGLRSIAQQLSGEIVVVWKSKAYRIR
jgi:hypothetical protein